MKNFSLNRLVTAFVSRRWTVTVVLALLVVWEVYGRFFNPRGPQYFPSATFTARQTWDHRELVFEGAVITLQGAVLAFAVAMVTGVILGIIVSELAVFRQLSMPVLVFSYSLPHAILAPLFIVWFGRDVVGVALFGAWVGFFPVFINTLTGMGQIREELRYYGRSLGATAWQEVRYIKFWEALPNIASSSRIAVQLSIVGVIIAEFLATGTGLGYLIVWAVQRARIGLAFGTIVAIMVLAVAIYATVSYTIKYFSPVKV